MKHDSRLPSRDRVHDNGISQTEKTGREKTFWGKDYELKFGHIEVDMSMRHLSGYI